MKEIVKNKLKEKVGKTLKFKYNGARNQIDEFVGKINQLYTNVFTVELIDSDINIKSFSYGDILIGTLEIFDK